MLSTEGVAAEEVIDLEPRLKRLLVQLGAGPDDVDDLVQEAIARTLDVRERLSSETVVAYAVVVARNELISGRRRRALEQRHLPRLLDLDPGPDGPELAEQRAEHDALRVAWGRLPASDRELLELRYLAAEPAAVGSAAAARLARARSRLRVEYVLALRRVELPSPRCRQVLLALSSGQQRRQRELDTAGHLVACVVCAMLAPALLRRSRALAALLWLVALPVALLQLFRRHPRTSGTAVALVLAASAGAVIVNSRPEPSREPSALAVERLQQQVGTSITVDGVRVLSVPADEGFWVAAGQGRAWVQLVTRGESGPTVRPGDAVAFTSRVQRLPAGFPARVGLTEAEGAALLVREGVYLSTPVAALRVR